MACIEELDHKDCIGLHSTNPPHTQCHRNRWLNKDCWISQSDRRLGNSCLFFFVCHLEDKNLVRPRSGLYQAGRHQFIRNFSSCSCRHVWANSWLIDDGMFRVWMSFRGRRDENQVNKHCCQSAERVHTTTLSSSDWIPCGRADLLAVAGLTTGQTGPAEKPASEATFRDYVCGCMLSSCCPF